MRAPRVSRWPGEGSELKRVASPARVHESRPSWSSATWRASARPSPTPSGLLVTNGSNRTSARSAGGPGPLSTTSIDTSPFA